MHFQGWLKSRDWLRWKWKASDILPEWVTVWWAFSTPARSVSLDASINLPHSSLLPLLNPTSPFFHGCWSWEDFSINKLNDKLSLRVCFLKNQNCNKSRQKWSGKISNNIGFGGWITHHPVGNDILIIGGYIGHQKPWYKWWFNC